MSRRPAPPSSSARTSERGTAQRSRPDAGAIDVRGWVSGIRLSSFMVIMLSLVVLGAWVLVPTLGTYVEQRQRIAALEQAVQVSEERIAELQAERDRWNDPAYITTQARERLYYVKPGEIVYLVDNDLAPDALPQEQKPVSDQLKEREADWMPQILRTLTAAGLAQTVTGPDAATPGS